MSEDWGGGGPLRRAAPPSARGARGEREQAAEAAVSGDGGEAAAGGGGDDDAQRAEARGARGGGGGAGPRVGTRDRRRVRCGEGRRRQDARSGAACSPESKASLAASPGGLLPSHRPRFRLPFSFLTFSVLHFRKYQIYHNLYLFFMDFSKI